MKTQSIQTFQYSCIEARIQVPEGAGFWLAFWMLDSKFPQVGWPDCGEINIMEYVGKDPTVIMGTLHRPGYSGALGFTKWNRQTCNIADDFHLYAIVWDEDEISWFFDGEKYHTVTREDVGERQWLFDQPIFIIINLAVGGTHRGLIHPSTVFLTQYLIDFVRVSQPTN